MLALLGLIGYIMSDSTAVNSIQKPGCQLDNFQDAERHEETDGQLVLALSAEKIEYHPRTKALVLTHLKGLFYLADVTSIIPPPQAVLTGDRNSLDIDQDVPPPNTEGSELKTDALHFDNTTKVLTKKSVFTLTTKYVTLTGAKLEGNLSLKIIQAIGNS